MVGLNEFDFIEGIIKGKTKKLSMNSCSTQVFHQTQKEKQGYIIKC